MRGAWVSDIHSQYPPFVVPLPGNAVQFGSRCWITTSRVDPPSISQILTSELEPESPICSPVISALGIKSSNVLAQQDFQLT